jgi:nucleotide-binding universal stress UspA family protein
MKTILVPCDFSRTATNAYKFALDIANQSNGVIHLLHVIELPVLHDTILMPVLNFEEQLLKELRENAEVKFSKLISTSGLPKSKLLTEVRFGSISKMICDYISEKEIDLVVMGSHGASGLREVFIGSNAEKIVRNSPSPVVVIKDYYKGPVKNIVFPNTLNTEKQEELVMKVKELQEFFQAKVHLLWVNTPINFTADDVTIARLQAFAKRFMLKNFTINIFNYPNEEDGIAKFAASCKADMIAMGTSGKTGFAHVLNGSIAEDVVNHSQNLVWTFTPKYSEVEA